MHNRSLIILCAICAATVHCTTQPATGNRWEVMRRQGFEDLRLPDREYLPLRHNSPEAIEAELRSKEVLGRLAAIVDADSNVIERTRFRVYADSLALTPEESAFFEKHPDFRLWMESSKSLVTNADSASLSLTR